MGYRNLFFAFILLLVKTVLSQNANLYTAAVVGIANTYDANDLPGTLRNNSQLYKSFIKQAAAGGAEIVVFPEYGLTSLGFMKPGQQLSSDDLLPISVVIPTEKYQNPNPCDNIEVRDIVNDVVAELSCAARDSRIYVVVNLMERSGDDPKKVDFYNTNIVFNRKGEIIARYRKYNLYQEPFFTRPPKPEEVTFDTDFGVKFGIFTCFDIMFESPALKLVQRNITHFVYPTAWLSELPFFTALQVQSGWAKTNGVNLLAAGLEDPNNWAGGSGIYSIQNMTVRMPILKENKILFAKVPKNKFTIMPFNDNDMPEQRAAGATYPGLKTMLRDLREFSHKNLNETNNIGEVVYKNFTCSYQVQMSDLESRDYNYKVIAYQGPIKVDSLTIPTQFCGVVACKNESINSCGFINYEADVAPTFPKIINVNITANFANHKSSFVLPSLVDYRLMTVDYNGYSFTRKNMTTLILRKPNSKMMTVGIAAHTWPNSAGFLEISKLLLLALAAIHIFKQFN